MNALAHRARSEAPRILDYALPGASREERDEAVQVLVSACVGTRQSSWQAVWNDLVADGGLRIGPVRCPECSGKRWSHRSYARTGEPTCRTCMGSGRSRPTVLRARPVPVPAEVSEA